MEIENVKYKISGSPKQLIVPAITLLIFGAVTIWLYLDSNSIFLFTASICAMMIFALIYTICHILFVKIFVDEYGFYHQSGINKGKYYNFSEIAEAWEDKDPRNNANCLYYKTNDGNTHKFIITSYKNYDGIEFIIERCDKNSSTI